MVKFLTSNATLPATWPAATFDDASWKSASLPIGFTDTVGGPTLNGGIVPGGQSNVYVRALVTLSQTQFDDALFNALVVRCNAVLSSDVYVNEQLVAGDASAGDEQRANYWNQEAVVAKSRFRVGANQLAFRIASTPTAKELLFDFELVSPATMPMSTATRSEDTFATGSVSDCVRPLSN